jgi:bifunctional DNase/RNase
MMVELHVHEVVWCGQHGHPVLALRPAGSDHYFAVAMSVEDAAALAPRPSITAPGSRLRLYTLLEETIAGLGGQVEAVHLRIGDDAILHASVHVAGPLGTVTLPSHFADGIAIAQRQRIPLRMLESDVDRIPSSVLPAPAQSHERAVENGLQPFRELIDSLDFDGLEPPTPA